jgi:hypothetical protein
VKTLQIYSLRDVVCTLSLVVCLFLVSGSMLPANSQEGAESISYESYSEINARWVEYQQTMEGLDRDAWKTKFDAFFTEISWDHLYNICLTEDCGNDSAMGREISDLIKARISVALPSTDELLMFLGDISICTPCLSPFLNKIFLTTDEILASGDAQVISEAIMTLAEDHEGLSRGALELEKVAVQLWSDEATMAKMMAYCTSTHLDSYLHGATMLSHSRDESATDSLQVIVEKWIEGIYTIEAFSVAMSGLAMRLGPDAYYIIDPVYRSERSEQTRTAAFAALMKTRNPRIFELLLDKYYEIYPEGVEQGTHALPSGTKRNDYFAIWQHVKETESGMIELLQSGPSEETTNAIEVLDRASQFAGPKDKSGLTAALETYLPLAPANQQARVEELIERIQNWKRGVRP